MRADGTFIGVEVDDAVAADPELARKLTEVCPVDIYAEDGEGQLEIVDANLDECVLCGLCLDAGPARRRQRDQALRRRGGPGLTLRGEASGAGDRRRGPLSLAAEGATSMNENFSLIVMCIFLLGSLAFLAQQLTSYH